MATAATIGRAALHSPNDTPTTVVHVGVVGAGAVGTEFVKTLVDGAISSYGNPNYDIHVFEKSEKSLGGGTAFGLAAPNFITNSPKDSHEGFPQWLKKNEALVKEKWPEYRPGDDKQRFPRLLLGEFLRNKFDLACQLASMPNSHVKVTVHFGDVDGIVLVPGKPTQLKMDGKSFTTPFDYLVVATGNADLSQNYSHLRDVPGYNPRPYPPEEVKLPEKTKSVLILGTGLTAIDAGMLTKKVLMAPAIIMASRRTGPAKDLFPPIESGIDIEHAPVHYTVEKARKRGQGTMTAEIEEGLWKAEVELVKKKLVAQGTPDEKLQEAAEQIVAKRTSEAFDGIWKMMSEEEKYKVKLAKRRHSRPSRTDVLKWEEVTVKGGIKEVRADPNGGFEATFDSGEGVETVHVDAVINATGANNDVTRTGSPLLKAMVKQGCQPDPLGGFKADDKTSQVIGTHGEPVLGVYLAGLPRGRSLSIRSGEYGQGTGIAKQIARGILDSEQAKVKVGGRS